MTNLIRYEEAPTPFNETEGVTLDALISRGLVAKVGFTADEVAGEWMWVHVVEQKPDESLAGILLNSPLDIDGLSYGDEVQGFRRDHIYEAHVDPDAGKYSRAARAARNRNPVTDRIGRLRSRVSDKRVTIASGFRRIPACSGGTSGASRDVR
jgi:Uncharacterized protein conserved in bacteria (DUF2314)